MTGDETDSGSVSRGADCRRHKRQTRSQHTSSLRDKHTFIHIYIYILKKKDYLHIPVEAVSGRVWKHAIFFSLLFFFFFKLSLYLQVASVSLAVISGDVELL